MSNVMDSYQVAKEMLSRGKKKERRLVEALKFYEDYPDSIAAQLELESAFGKRYGKPASAKVIADMARVWGPQKAFKVFSSSFQRIVCDFDNHKLKTTLQEYPLWKRSLVGVMSFLMLLLGMVVVMGDTFFLFKGFMFLYAEDSSYLKELNLNQFFVWLSVVALLIGTGLVGAMSFWFGTKIVMSNDNSDIAVRLVELVNESNR